MEYKFTDYDFSQLGLKIEHIEKFSDCQISIVNEVTIDREKRLKEFILFADINFESIKKQIVCKKCYQYAVKYIDTKKCKNNLDFIYSLNCSAIQLREDNLFDIVLDNEEIFFGHYIAGVFSQDWEYEGYCLC